MKPGSVHHVLRASLAVALIAALGACDVSIPLRSPESPSAPGPRAKPPSAPPAPHVDPLGERPKLAPPKAFTPPRVDVFSLDSGVSVWLVERHGLPLVSITLAVPVGSAADPADKPGLASLTADMLDEGAGARSAVELSSAINDLGASLSVFAGADGSFASLTSLKKNLTPAFAIFGDVVARPRFDEREYKRVASLWQNGLKKRADDPASVSRVVANAALYGPGSAYGHPSEGLLRGAAKINLESVKSFYKGAWRPDRATLVVVGDVTRDEITKLAATAFAGWKAGPPAAPPAAPTGPAKSRPKLVLVDRKDAPQSVICVIREGVAAADPRAPELDLVNTALGGSFTSRLNQNLREDHGWSYGARSAFTEARGVGAFVARAAVRTEVTGEALAEMLKELSGMSERGLSDAELAKVQAQDRGDLVQTYETVSGMSRRLASLATLGLPPSFDASASAARQGAKLERLAALAKAHVDPKEATVIVVGPRAAVEPQLGALGLGEPEIWDAEGNPQKEGVARAPRGKP